MGPDNSLERREGWPRPSWDRAISRVRGSLREQRGEGCLALCELHVPCAAGSPRPAGHVLTWQGCTLLKHSAGRFWVGTATVRSEKVFLSGPSRSACARAPPGRADHARWAAGTLLYKHTYNSFSGVVAPARSEARLRCYDTYADGCSARATVDCALHGAAFCRPALNQWCRQ